MENFYKKHWQKLLGKNFFPSYLNKIQSFEFENFKEIILAKDEKSINFLNQVFYGDALIIKNVFKKKEIIDLKNSIFDIQGPELVSVKKILDLLSKKYPRKIKIKEISPDNFSIRKITNNYNKNLNWKPKIFVSEGINRIYKKYYNKQ